MDCFFSNDHTSLPSNNIQLKAFQVLRLCIFYIYNCSRGFLAAYNCLVLQVKDIAVNFCYQQKQNKRTAKINK
jgi:hypothetical protein